MRYSLRKRRSLQLHSFKLIEIWLLWISACLISFMRWIYVYLWNWTEHLGYSLSCSVLLPVGSFWWRKITFWLIYWVCGALIESLQWYHVFIICEVCAWVNTTNYMQFLLLMKCALPRQVRRLRLRTQYVFDHWFVLILYGIEWHMIDRSCINWYLRLISDESGCAFDYQLSVISCLILVDLFFMFVILPHYDLFVFCFALRCLLFDFDFVAFHYSFWCQLSLQAGGSSNYVESYLFGVCSCWWKLKLRSSWRSLHCDLLHIWNLHLGSIHHLGLASVIQAISLLAILHFQRLNIFWRLLLIPTLQSAAAPWLLLFFLGLCCSLRVFVM